MSAILWHCHQAKLRLHLSITPQTPTYVLASLQCHDGHMLYHMVLKGNKYICSRHAFLIVYLIPVLSIFSKTKLGFILA